MAGRNPRDPKAVRKLIADANARQVERGLLAWMRRRGLIVGDKPIDLPAANGTRKRRRDG